MKNPAEAAHRERMWDSKSIELRQTLTNCDKLGRGEKDDVNSMNYGEWSKSIELDRTVTPNFAARERQN
jgi:hypothetical protein